MILETLKATTAKSVAVLRSGTCYILPLLGAFLADSYWGRYFTIIVFSIVYILVCTATYMLPQGWVCHGVLAQG